MSLTMVAAPAVLLLLKAVRDAPEEPATFLMVADPAVAEFKKPRSPAMTTFIVAMPEFPVMPAPLTINCMPARANAYCAVGLVKLRAWIGSFVNGGSVKVIDVMFESPKEAVPVGTAPVDQFDGEFQLLEGGFNNQTAS